MNNTLPTDWFQLSDLEQYILINERQITNYEKHISRGKIEFVPLVEKLKQEIQNWKLELVRS